MPTPTSRAHTAGIRKKIHPATEAALWALSNGRCYAPRCPMPVILETRPGVYRKNAWVSHIYGVRQRAARYREGMSSEERDSFKNLLLLCMPHHTEVDDEKTGEQFYPPDVLQEWKVKHEGSNGPALAALGTIDPEQLTDLLTATFTPPLDRLEAITQRLEETGTASAETVAELKQVLAVMSSTAEGIDAQTARSLAFAAEVLGTSGFHTSASQLGHAAEVIGTRGFYDSAGHLGRAAELLNTTGFHNSATHLGHAAEVLPTVAAQIAQAANTISQFR